MVQSQTFKQNVSILNLLPQTTFYSFSLTDIETAWYFINRFWHKSELINLIAAAIKLWLIIKVANALVSWH